MITEKNLEYEGTRTFWQNSLLSKAIVLPTLKQESSIEKNDGLKYISESLLTMKQTLRDLLYNPKRDGDSAESFHKCCDNKGPLLFLIKTKEGKKFGIYISKSWKSDGKTYTDSTQMIISLDNSFAIKSLNDNATYHCYPNQGPSFHCMSINVPFLTSSSTDIQSCSDFTLPCYPSGNSSYYIEDLEVYSVLEF